MMLNVSCWLASTPGRNAVCGRPTRRRIRFAQLLTNVDKLKKAGRADRTISKVKWLLDFAYPTFGDKCIREIDPATVLTALRGVEVRGRYESARRLRSTLGTVFRYAIATSRAEADPTLALRGALISPTVTPRAARCGSFLKNV